MELYKEILIKLLETEESQSKLLHTSLNLHEVIQSRCYQTLMQIKAVLEDHTLDDPECFEKIEAIVSLFEKLGSGCGSRHDFGS